MKAGAKNSSGYGLRRLFWRGMLEHAILRWESAALLSFVLLSATAGWTAAMSGALSHWTWPVVPLICLAGEAVLIWTSLRDPDTNRVVVSQLLLDTYRPQQLADPELSHRVMVALDLRARIEALTRNSRYISQGPVHAELALQFDRWFGVICELAAQLDRFKSELGFSTTQARGSAERARDLEKLAAVEVDPTTSQEIAATIAGHEALLDNLYQVRKAVERADLRLERSVSQLANIHAQVVLLIARGPQVDFGSFPEPRDRHGNRQSAGNGAGDELSGSRAGARRLGGPRRGSHCGRNRIPNWNSIPSRPQACGSHVVFSILVRSGACGH